MGAPPETPRPDPGLSRAGPPMQSRSSTRANIKWFPRGVEAAGGRPAVLPEAVLPSWWSAPGGRPPPALNNIFFFFCMRCAKKKTTYGKCFVFRGGFDALLVPGQGIPCLNADPVRGSSSSLNARMTKKINLRQTPEVGGIPSVFGN